MGYLGHWYATGRIAGGADAPAPVRGPAPAATPVRVVGGALTPQIQEMAERFHSRGLVADWARRTGSDPAKIRAAMESD